MSQTSKRLTTTALHALDVIGEIAGAVGGTKGKTAEVALKTIAAIVGSVQDGYSREISPDEVLKQIEAALGRLETDIAANDAAADAALKQKFPSEPAVDPA